MQANRTSSYPADQEKRLGKPENTMSAKRSPAASIVQREKVFAYLSANICRFIAKKECKSYKAWVTSSNYNWGSFHLACCCVSRVESSGTVVSRLARAPSCRLKNIRIILLPVTKMKLALLLLSLLAPITTAQRSHVLYVAGSGTTNPSRCYWDIMNSFELQSKLPIRMTYRAVGSTTGQEEFVNDNKEIAATHFGSGDLPLTKGRYDSLTAAGHGVMQFPILVGTVSFFHSIPGVQNLNLTAENIAKIYKYEITDWKDSAIKADNPNMVLDANADTTIYHFRRVKGSSSTAAATQVSNWSYGF